MKHIRTSTARRKMFKPLLSSRDAQAAMMTLQPGKATGEIQDEHAAAEQWLFVIAGSGIARTKRSRIAIREGSLLLIKKREPHQIKNIGRKPLVTINFYVPPAYTPDGEVRPAVKD